MTSRRARIESVDVVRGLIMVAMALDHARDFLGAADDPTDVAHASAALFFTRWVTHFCAPVFFLLTGVGARLSLGRRSPAALSRFLVTRGAWLILLEVTVLRCFAYQFNADYHVTMLIVIWALGWSMIALAGLSRLPDAAVAAFGLVLVLGHNLLDPIESTSPLWAILHARGFVVNRPGVVVFAVYPLVPWVGVTALGWTLGATYRWDAERRRAWLARLGLAACVAFVAVRGWNGYGDPAPWEHQATTLRTAMSFLNTVKYPPSLCFLLMTLGPALLLLRATDTGAATWLRPVLVVGKVPFFYYAVHFALIHAIAVGVCLARTGTVHWLFESPTLDRYPFTRPPGWGFPLPLVYLAWIAVVLAMYPPCRWFADVKARRDDAWLSYL
ncbi:MAG TPA: heparan-alpha-glucosaminide N-acetyltransferase domain-containing protein [Polyangiaceae bacterium]